MLGIGLSQIMPPKEDATQEEIDIIESWSFSLSEYLHDELETLRSDYAEANFDKLPDAIIAERLAALNKHEELIKDTQEMAHYFDDEIAKLAKGDPTPLRIDPQLSARPGFEHYTIISVKECENVIRASIRKSKKSNSGFDSGQQDKQQANVKPWLIPDPNDPPTKIDWHPAARYFARQHIADDHKLLNNKASLAKKVQKSLADHKIYKRGKEKLPTPETIRNAFMGAKFK